MERIHAGCKFVQICIRHRKLKRFWKSNARLRERPEGDRTRALVAQGAQVNSLQSGEDESWWWRMVVWWRTICASMWVMTQHLNHPKLQLDCLLGGVMCFMCSVWCGSTNSKIAWVLRSIARILPGFLNNHVLSLSHKAAHLFQTIVGNIKWADGKGK